MMAHSDNTYRNLPIPVFLTGFKIIHPGKICAAKMEKIQDRESGNFLGPHGALCGLKNQVTLHRPGFHRVNIVNTILNFYGLIC